jgi:hypothetical protein
MGQRLQLTPKTCPPIPLSNRKIAKITKSKVAKRPEICLLKFIGNRYLEWLILLNGIS